MKNFLIVLTLLSLVACKASKSSKSKTCTYNDEPVDCSTMESVKAQPFTLISNVKAHISISENKIEILENTENTEREVKDGNSYECRSSTHAGDVFDFSIDGKKLKLKFNNGVETFTRISGQSKNILGVWNKVESDDTGKTTVTVTFTEEKMELNINCYFKYFFFGTPGRKARDLWYAAEKYC